MEVKDRTDTTDRKRGKSSRHIDDGSDKIRSNNRGHVAPSMPNPPESFSNNHEGKHHQPTVANVDALFSQAFHLVVLILKSSSPEDRTAKQEEMCRLFFSKSNELLKIIELAPFSDDECQVDPAYVAFAFARVLEEQDKDHHLKPGTPPSRAKRLWRAFRGRENQTLSIELLVREFSDAKDPENSARTAISRINQAFSKLGLHLFIDHVTAYRLRLRS